jgi:hypothetical protein
MADSSAPERLREQFATALGYTLDKLTAAQAARLDTAVMLRVELDAQAARQLKGSAVDLNKIVAASDALAEILAPTQPENQCVVFLEPGDEGYPQERTDAFLENLELKKKVADLSAEIELLKTKDKVQ